MDDILVRRQRKATARRELDALIRGFPLEQLVYETELPEGWFDIAAEWELVSDHMVGVMSTDDVSVTARLTPGLLALREMVRAAPSGNLRADTLLALGQLIEWATEVEGPPQGRPGGHGS